MIIFGSLDVEVAVVVAGNVVVANVVVGVA